MVDQARRLEGSPNAALLTGRERGGKIHVMSIIWTLRKFIDSIEHREEEAAHERDRRLARRQALGEGDGEAGAVPPPAVTKQYECRVCRHRSSESRYCPECLADTMVELGDEEKPATESDPARQSDPARR